MGGEEKGLVFLACTTYVMQQYFIPDMEGKCCVYFSTTKEYWHSAGENKQINIRQLLVSLKVITAHTKCAIKLVRS